MFSAKNIIMKFSILITLFIIVTNICFSQSSIEKEVLAVEQARFNAMANKDFEKLEQIISDDLHYIHSNGSYDSKRSFLDAIKKGNRSYDRITIEKSKVRIYGKTAIINAECTYHRKKENGEPNNLKLRYTNVYIKQKGQWKFVTWQSFKI